MDEILLSHPVWWIGASSALFGMVIGALRGGQASRTTLTFDALVLFAAATIVCDAMRWMGWSADWGVNPYALCVGFFVVAAARAAMRRTASRSG